MKTNLLSRTSLGNPFKAQFLFLIMLFSSVGVFGQSTYKLITATSDLVAGEKYLIGSAQTGTTLLLSDQATNNRPQATGTAITITSSTVTVTPATTTGETAKPYELTLGGTSGAWVLNDVVNNTILGPSEGNFKNNYLRANPLATYTITFSSNAAVMTAVTGQNTDGTGRNIIRFNTNLFSSYASGQAAVYLYRKMYKVTYDGNSSTGGTIPTDASSPYFSGATVTVKANTGTLVKSGFTFSGWNTKADGTGTDYSASGSATFTMPSSDVILYAQWTSAGGKTVSFNGNGSDGGSMSPQNASVATALTANTFTRTGYTFAGWNTVADGSGTAYADGASYPFTADATLYAQWTIKNNTVTFDANGGTGSPSVATVNGNYNTSVTLATIGTLAKTGYTFGGWNILADGSGSNYAAGSGYTVPAGNITLYAKWTPTNYTITFDKNDAGATGSMSNQTIAYGATASLTSNNYALSGYAFDGWATSAGGAVAYTNAANYTMGAGNVTLYAKWSVYVGPCFEAAAVDTSVFTRAGSTTLATSNTALRLASGSNPGSISTIALTSISAGNVTFKAEVRGWSSTEKTFTVNLGGVTGTGTVVSTFASNDTSTAFEVVEILLNSVPTNPILSISCASANRVTFRNIQLFCSSTPTPAINIKQSTTNIPTGTGTYGFGNQLVGSSSSPVSFTIENTGTANLTLGTIALSGTNVNQFSVTQAAITPVAGGASTTFTGTFSPSSLGSKTATVTIPNNAGADYTFTITGTGTNSADGDIISNGTYTYTSNIDYLTWQSASILNTGSVANGSVGVYGFTIRDGGATADADALSTSLTAIGFSYSGSSNTIRAASLFDGPTKLVDGTVTANGITFSGLSGTSFNAPDGSTKSLDLRVTFTTTVTDNDQLQFTIASATANTAGSVFAAPNAGGATSSITVDRNRIEVMADRLAFVQQPTTTNINATMSPAVTVSAQDINGNRDLDFTNSVSIASSGTMTGDPIAVSATSGLATYSSVVHTVSQTGRQLTATYNTWNVVSNSFDITNVSYPSNSYHTASTGTWNSTGTGTATWNQWTGSGWIYGVPAPGSSGDKNIFIHHNVTIPSSNGSTGNYTITVMDNAKLIFNGSSSWTAKGMDIKAGSTLELNTTSLGINSAYNFEVQDLGNVTLNALFTNASPIWTGTEIFHPNSNFVLNEWSSNASTTGNRPFFDEQVSTNIYNGYKAAFGNLEIDLSTSTEANTFILLSTGVSSNLAHGNLHLISPPYPSSDKYNIGVLSTGSATSGIGGTLTVDDSYKATRKVIFANSGSLNFVIGGSMQLDGATTNLSAFTSNTVSVTVKGDLNITAGAVLDVGGSAGSNLNINLDLEGDLSVVGSGLLKSQTDGANFNFSKTGGDGLSPATTQTINILSTSTNKNRQLIFNVNLGAYAKLVNDFTLGTESKLNVTGTFDSDDKILKGESGTQSLTVAGTGLFKTANANGFSRSTNTSVDTSVENITLAAGSTVEYYGANQQITHGPATTAPTGANYQNLRISGTGVKTATAVTTVNEKTFVDAAQLLLPGTTDDNTPNVLTAKKGIQLSGTGQATFENNANIIQDTDAANIGSVTMKRTAIVPSIQYNFWSSPVEGQSLYGLYQSGNNVPANRVFTYNTATDFYTVVPSGNFTKAIGYSIKGEPFEDSSAKFFGEIHNSTTNLSLANTGNRYNLIGNPYPSNLDNDKFFQTNQSVIESTFWFWDFTANNALTQMGPAYNSYTTNNFATWNASANVGTPGSSTLNNAAKEPNGIISIAQGFIVQVKTGVTSPSVSYLNTQRNPVKGKFFGKESEERDLFKIQMISPKNLVNTIAVIYTENASNQFDTFDSELGSLGSDAIYSFADSSTLKLGIQGKQYPLINSDVVPLGTKYFENGTYTIAITQNQGIFANGQPIYLKDKLLNIVTNLNEGPYQFTAVRGVDEGRFEIVYKPTAVLATGENTKDQLQVYRNGEDFIVQSGSGIIDEVEVFDASGRLFQKVKGGAVKIVVDGKSLVNGMYILKIKRKTDLVSKKIMK